MSESSPTSELHAASPEPEVPARIRIEFPSIADQSLTLMMGLAAVMHCFRDIDEADMDAAMAWFDEKYK